MRPFPVALLLASLAILPAPACAAPDDAPPAPARDDASLRRNYLDAARAEEDLLQALKDRGAAADEIATSEARLRDLYAKLGAAAPGGAVRVARPAVVPQPARVPFDGSAGLRPLQARSGQDEVRVVESALDWLARHQSEGGAWDCDGFGARCRDGKCPGAGGALYDPGVTGLATLAFLGTGETHKSERHGETVRAALKYLKGIQDAEGCFGPRTSGHFTYNHALATLAYAEAYGLTQSPLFKEPAQKGLDFIEHARNPYLGWRYGVRPQDNDTSITTWMVMALKSGKLAGLEVEPAAFDGALAWIEKVTEPEYGRTGYTARGNGPARPQDLMDRFPVDKSESLTAEAVVVRMLCGARSDDVMVRKGLELLGKRLPRWDEADGSIDLYYWYFGTLATIQAGGSAWPSWKAALSEALWTHQRGDGDGCSRGSWDPIDPWGADGGRVYSTALGALASECWFRYQRVEKR